MAIRVRVSGREPLLNSVTQSCYSRKRGGRGRSREREETLLRSSSRISRKLNFHLAIRGGEREMGKLLSLTAFSIVVVLEILKVASLLSHWLSHFEWLPSSNSNSNAVTDCQLTRLACLLARATCQLEDGCGRLSTTRQEADRD